jgi:aspartate carbamoyltransferase regulatory subunit
MVIVERVQINKAMAAADKIYCPNGKCYSSQENITLSEHFQNPT